MDEKYISYLAFESVTARQERTIKRLWILVIIIFLAGLFTNVGWVYYENQFVETEISQEIDTDSGSAVVIGMGNYNGENQAND